MLVNMWWGGGGAAGGWGERGACESPLNEETREEWTY